MIPKHQIDTYLKLSQGFKRGEMAIISSGRQSGKSYYYQKMLLNSVFGSLYNTNIDSLYPNMFLIQPQSKYKFSRANWYVAEFDDRKYFEVEEWCTKHFGPHPKNPDAWSPWVHKYSEKIHFRDEKDYVLFMLRWS